MERDLHQSNPARDREEDAPEPPQIRRFRRLVSLTMVAMVIGILGITGALVWKLTQTPPLTSQAVVEGEIDVPAGFSVLTVSRSRSSIFLIFEHDETGERVLHERRTTDSRLIGRYALKKQEM